MIVLIVLLMTSVPSCVRIDIIAILRYTESDSTRESAFTTHCLSKKYTQSRGRRRQINLVPHSFVSQVPYNLMAASAISVALAAPCTVAQHYHAEGVNQRITAVRSDSYLSNTCGQDPKKSLVLTSFVARKQIPTHRNSAVKSNMKVCLSQEFERRSIGKIGFVSLLARFHQIQYKLQYVALQYASSGG